ncbi:hypothetical protein CQ13_04430 [Bradyrhizobium retamae]|uniref:HTH crp-type domain-containing protein n=1 Tax=Bradyrhizobium retamae TaxID=1300035 RepID=A0A0R3NCM4_9BRAD|nr:hypothetical protein CQ13_04430 [Bradyrhizobium retamae]
MRERLSSVGLIADHQFEFSVTQVDLADALGLSAVHVNRVIQEFRKDGVLDSQRNMVTLNDAAKVAEIGVFDNLLPPHT